MADDDVTAQVERRVRPYATSVTWRNDQGGSWQQWHDDNDPMPTEWDDSPPDEVVHVYSAAQVAELQAADTELLRRALHTLVWEVGSDGLFAARTDEVLKALRARLGA